MQETKIAQLKAQLSGNVITPSDEAYEQTRSIYMHDGHPAVIIQPKNAQDIATAVKFAKDNSLTLSVRSGGHSNPGFGTNVDGLVIDLSLLKSIEIVDEEQHIVRIGAGCLWGEVAEELGKHQLAISSGDTKSVGVGGLTLGGGIGWLVREHGLALDNLVAAEIVTANGEILHLSETDNPDLFWAIRGGGGNFGVVTWFEFKAHALNGVVAGKIMYTLENVLQLLKGWRDYMRSAPLELNTTLLVMPQFGEAPPAAMLLVCYGDSNQEKANRAIDPLLQLGTVTMKDIKPKTYADVLEEAHPPSDMTILGKNAMVDDFSDELIMKIISHVGRADSPMFMLRSVKGKLNEVPVDATAFAHRDAEVFMMYVKFIPGTATLEQKEETFTIWDSFNLPKHSAYVNFLMTRDETDEAYPTKTLERLREIKGKYDSENMFNQNFNVKI